jgi:hypothetical protein
MAAGPRSGAERPLGRLFLLIVLTEIATLLALYWFGRHFS